MFFQLSVVLNDITVIWRLLTV